MSLLHYKSVMNTDQSKYGVWGENAEMKGVDVACVGVRSSQVLL
jgi:hypothetical protein